MQLKLLTTICIHAPFLFTGGRCASLRWGFRSGLPNVRGARYVLGISFAPGAGALAAPPDLPPGNATRNSTVEITLRNATAAASSNATVNTTAGDNTTTNATAAAGNDTAGGAPLMQSLELIISLEPLKRSFPLDARKDYR